MATAKNNDIAEAIYLASKENPTNVVSETLNFLIRKNLLSRTPDILERLEKIIHKAENKIVVKVTSAEKLEHKNKTELELLLKKRYKVEHILMNEIVNEKIIGGIKIEVEDEVIDLTVKNRIQKLQEHLTRYV